MRSSSTAEMGLSDKQKAVIAKRFPMIYKSDSVAIRSYFYAPINEAQWTLGAHQACYHIEPSVFYSVPTKFCTAFFELRKLCRSC